MGWINKWIHTIEKRPEMYLGNNCRVEDFYVFITGYIASRQDCNMESFDLDEEALFGEFTKWMEGVTKMQNKNCSWLVLVNLYSNKNGIQDTFKCFTNLWKEFLESRI